MIWSVRYTVDSMYQFKVAFNLNIYSVQLKKYKSNNLPHMNRRIVRSTGLKKASESLINDFNVSFKSSKI